MNINNTNIANFAGIGDPSGNTRAILDFLDGSLTPDQEAELMHRLSVSPERRTLLRSYMNQASLFARDRQSIQVPYAAEQGLWEKLGAVMPVALPAAEQIAPVVSTSGKIATSAAPFFSRIFTGTTAAIGTATLMFGLLAGYFFGQSNTNNSTLAFVGHSATSPLATLNNSTVPQQLSASVLNSQAASSDVSHFIQISHSGELSQTIRTLRSENRILQNMVNALEAQANNAVALASTPVIAHELTPSMEQRATENTTVLPAANAAESSDFAAIEPRESHAEYRITGPDGNKPIFLHSGNTSSNLDKSLLQRFEFNLTESFGRQYPNSIATNTSMPLITNSAISAFFQILPHSEALWVGLSAGTANITKKNIFTQAGNQLDHLQEVVTSDTIHAQTGYFAGFLQYRVPAFAGTQIMFTGGYGLASLGNMIMGELGVHYDISREVGFQMGLRGSRFTYDLTQEKANAIRSGSGSLVVPKGVDEASPSFNIELNTGLFFHF